MLLDARNAGKLTPPSSGLIPAYTKNTRSYKHFIDDDSTPGPSTHFPHACVPQCPNNISFHLHLLGKQRKNVKNSAKAWHAQATGMVTSTVGNNRLGKKLQRNQNSSPTFLNTQPARDSHGVHDTADSVAMVSRILPNQGLTQFAPYSIRQGRSHSQHAIRTSKYQT